MRMLLAATAVAGLVAVSAPAHAQRHPINEGNDTRPCVTFEEFDSAFHLGMPEHRVQRVFDVKGHRVSRHELETILGTVGGDMTEGGFVRSYPSCDDASPVLVGFRTGGARPRARSGSYGF